MGFKEEKKKPVIINPKDKSMIARMAGNIAAGLVSDGYPSSRPVIAVNAVDIAIAIIAEIDSRIEKKDGLAE